MQVCNWRLAWRLSLWITSSATNQWEYQLSMYLSILSLSLIIIPESCAPPTWHINGFTTKYVSKCGIYATTNELLIECRVHVHSTVTLIVAYLQEMMNSWWHFLASGLRTTLQRWLSCSRTKGGSLHMSYCGLANGDMTGQLDSKLDITHIFEFTVLGIVIVQNNNYYVVW